MPIVRRGAPSEMSPAPRPPVQYRLGRLVEIFLPRPGEPSRLRDSVGLLSFFLVAVLLWCTGLTLLEFGLGLPFLPTGGANTRANYLDALWHLGTGALLALPFRRRSLYVLLPAFSLGLDVDHLFGYVLPAPFGREAHNLFFLALLAGISYATVGRFLSASASAGWLTHIAVDGGAFPLFAPFSTQTYPLPYALELLLLAGALIAAHLSVRSLRSLREARYWGPILLTGLAFAALLYWVGPALTSFRTS